MSIREKLILKIENLLEYRHPKESIDLSKLSDEEREEVFITFGEGNEHLTRLLKVAYSNNVSSQFCCSGHNGLKRAYVVFEVNEDNIKYLQKVGKILSKSNVVTNFENNFTYGKRVSFHGRDYNNNWFEYAADIMENINEYEVTTPDIYYHEDMYDNIIPFGYRVLQRLLNILKNEKLKIKKLPFPKNNRDRNIRDTIKVIPSEENEEKAINNTNKEDNNKERL